MSYSVLAAQMLIWSINIYDFEKNGSHKEPKYFSRLLCYPRNEGEVLPQCFHPSCPHTHSTAPVLINSLVFTAPKICVWTKGICPIFIWCKSHNGNLYIWGVANVGMPATVWQMRESSHLPDLSSYCVACNQAFRSVIPLVLFAIMTNVMAEYIQIAYADDVFMWITTKVTYGWQTWGHVPRQGFWPAGRDLYHGKSLSMHLCMLDSTPKEK